MAVGAVEVPPVSTAERRTMTGLNCAAALLLAPPITILVTRMILLAEPAMVKISVVAAAGVLPRDEYLYVEVNDCMPFCEKVGVQLASVPLQLDGPFCAKAGAAPMRSATRSSAREKRVSMWVLR